MDRFHVAKSFAEDVFSRFRDSVRTVLLYGSVARGDSSGDSDIDLLVVWDGNKREGWDKLEELAFKNLLETEEYISLKILSPREFKRLQARHNPFLNNVLKDGVQLV